MYAIRSYYGLKDDVAQFTKQLFYTLFDEDQHQHEELQSLKFIFLKLVSHVSSKNGEELWKAFLKRLPEVKRKIELDALATEQNDPASKSLDEIYLAYPGFHAIAIVITSYSIHYTKLYEQELPKIMNFRTIS